jgi:S-DNA-T family DNA segregation ATPase FtsK/SpoIIIE
VAITAGALSFFKASDGVMARSTLGGYWGSTLGGASLSLGLLKLGAIAVSVPLMVAPRHTARIYLRTLQAIGLGLRYGATDLYLLMRHMARFLYPRLRLALNSRYRRRWLRRKRRQLAKWFPVKPLKRWDASINSPPAQSHESPASQASSLWTVTEGGTISDPESNDLPPPGDLEVEKGPDLRPHKGSKWRLPSPELLSVGERREPPQTQLQQMARHIESTLEDHGVTVEVKDIKAGPRIVRFGLVPGWVSKKSETGKGGPGESSTERSRVKVQSILTREKDLALALKTPYLRIEAPVPGEALVGLEVPTPSPSKVPLRAVMDTPAFRKAAARGGLPIALGQDTGGNPVVVDLATLPHFLIAGATGSGKSVCINTIIASLLLTRPPDQIRMLMVDPKRVELTPFNGIPHLIAPVIVEADQVNSALRALTREMFRRYKQMEETGTRNIISYNARTRDRLPYLVLIVDELADLMMVGGFEVEQSLVRLAQLGRATGIHLVLATQRPSVNVVTGLLKANIPTRVAFAVASQVDSRVILDTVGAEKLLGKGDMLLLNHDSPKPRRVQGTLVYDEEINKLVDFWHNQKGPPLPVIPMEEPEDEKEQESEIDENTLERARELALRNPRLSASFLERRLKIGEHRAAQIVELLEDEGLVIRQ